VECERFGLDADPASDDDGSMPPEESPDRKKVFIIHGRNTAARTAVEHFLKALKLEPIDFRHPLRRDGHGVRRQTSSSRDSVAPHGIVALFHPRRVLRSHSAVSGGT